MSEADTLTLPCPHCFKPVRAKAGSAGQQVWCPHADCRRAVHVPFSLDEDEPEEAVLIPEDPADPQPVPVAPLSPTAKPAPTPPPTPRQNPRRHEDEEVKPRVAVLPWALTALALLLASGAVVGWTLSATRDPVPAAADGSADRVAALEADNRDLRAENRKLRDQLDAVKSVVITPKQADALAPAPARTDTPIPPLPQRIRPDREPPAKPLDNPLPRLEPAKPARGRDAFVGTWVLTGPQLPKHDGDFELTADFRADGKLTLTVRGGGIDHELTGKWRWDGRLHLEHDNHPGETKAAEVKWNGPDEFVGTADGVPVTFRRKAKP